MSVKPQADPPQADLPSPDVAVGWLERMLYIRKFEDAIYDLFAEGHVKGSTHLAQGQEAVAVGVAAAVGDDDVMTTTYRGHGHCLAWGMPVQAAMDEVLGRATGCCGGRGGSMHLTDVERGILGSFAIVGAGLPVAAGAAWASQYRSSQRVAVSFFGDGATNIGTFHETLNLASVWKLPIIFVCENNLYGEYSHISRTTPITDLADRAAAYGMPGEVVDGNDLLAVRAATKQAADRAREKGGPTLLEMKTYRQKGHSRGDPATYRPDDEVKAWLERDPILLWQQRLKAADYGDDDRFDALEARVEEDVQQAVQRGLEAPSPEPATLHEEVYSA